MEFDENTIESLLNNASLLALGAFDWIRKNIMPLHFSHVIDEVADEFDRFSSEVSAFRSENGLSQDILNNDKSIVTQVLLNNPLVERIKSIVQETSNRISDFVTPADEWE